MGMKGADGPPQRTGIVARAGAVAPGLAVALVIAAAASFVSATYGGPVMLMALLMGMALNFLSEEGRCIAGIEFAAKRVLRLGIALLGLRISASHVLGLGAATIEFVIAGVVVTVLAGVLLARAVGRGNRFGVLIGGATAICGASAALALASVLPPRPDGQRETIFAVIAVTTLSTIAMIIYPAAFTAMGFDDRTIGVLIGATVHDVAQVVGAGYAVSDPTGDTATIVKLFRVALLLPLLLVVSMLFAGSDRSAAAKPWLALPFFAIAFAALVALNSTGVVPAFVSDPLIALSRWCLIAAVAAIGLSTSLKEIAKVGPRAIVVAVGATLALALYSIALVGWAI